MPYHVGIDLGAAYSAAAVTVVGRTGLPEIVPLATRSPFLPSVVFADPGGTLLVGEPAEQRALTDPGRLARLFTRRIGDGTPLRIGGAAVPAEELAARVILHVLDIVTTRLGGEPAGVAVTHPAGWGPHRLMSLRAALAGHGLDSALLLSEPQAAAIAYAGQERFEPGAAVAVYDLGGGGFTATVVRRAAADQFVLAGQPEELELSGLDLDEVVFDHVRSAVGPAWDALDPADPGVLAAVARLRRGCIVAKEALSADTDVLIPVQLPGIDTQVRLGRAEFEELIRPAVAETVEALHRALASAGTSSGEIAAVLLVGGSARVPLITQEVSAQLGRPVSASMDPKGIIAMGAALAARGPEPEPDTVLLPVPAAVPVLGAAAAPPAGPLAGQDMVPAAWARPPLLVGPPSTYTSGPWRRLVKPAAVTAAALVAFLVIGGVARANRGGSDQPPGTRPPTTSSPTTSPPATWPSTTSSPIMPLPITESPGNRSPGSQPSTSRPLSPTASPTTVSSASVSPSETPSPPVSPTAVPSPPASPTPTTTKSTSSAAIPTQTSPPGATPPAGSTTADAAGPADTTPTRTP